MALSALVAMVGLGCGLRASTAETVFQDVNVIPMSKPGVLQHQDVRVADGRVVSVQPTGRSPLGDATAISGSGKFLIPGLTEMHGHIPAPTDDPKYVENVLFLYLSNGVTTVRGMLGWPGQLDLRERARKKELLSPTLYLAGPSFNGNSIHSPQEAIDKVRLQKKEGWDLLKIHPGLTLDEYDAMARTADEVGIRFAGHIRRMSDSCTPWRRGNSPSTTWTAISSTSPPAAPSSKSAIGNLNDSGVPILLGTDAPQLFSVPGFSIHREVALMREAGMTPWEILCSGTVNVGRHFAAKDRFGAVEPGSRADLLLLEANPLDDLANLKRRAGVMVRGRWIPESEIQVRLTEIAESNAHSN